jgi:hypothetical protein
MEKATTTVLFTMPEGLPCSSDWDFTVCPGTFALLLEPLQQHIQWFIARDRRAWLALLVFTQVRREHRELIRLRSWLQKLRGSQGSYELDSRFQLIAWSRAGELIYSRRFAFSRCPACQRDYPPTEGIIAEWSRNGGIYGGRRFICPQGHTLYATTEWSAMIDRTPETVTRVL